MTDPSSAPTTHADGVARVRALIKDARTAMLTTVSADGSLVARPMATQEVEFDGDAWFFAEAGSAKVAEIEADSRVNAAYSEGSYVSLSGDATIVRDPAKKRELWNSYAEAWLQCEPEDDKVVLIRLSPDSAEFWDTPHKAVTLLKVARAKVTGGVPDVGENATVRL